MFCRKCGASNLDDAIYCVKCGQLCAPPDADRLDCAPTEATLPKGTVLSNRYVVERLLGAGGMGQVYLAEDRVLKIPVAIKTVKDLLRQDPGSFARLIEEARKATRLAQEHIVRVNHFEDGELLKFLVMEYVEGETLAHRLARERRLPEEEARRIRIALCDALAYAHAKGVVHRDVKPGKVLLGTDGPVRLANFGIARVARDSMSRLTQVVTSGTLICTAPEQVDGEHGTARSDLYAVGVMLYEAVAGGPSVPSKQNGRAIRVVDRPITTSPAGSQIIGRLSAAEFIDGWSPNDPARTTPFVTTIRSARVTHADRQAESGHHHVRKLGI